MQPSNSTYPVSPSMWAADQTGDDSGERSHRAYGTSQDTASLRIAVVEDEPFVRMDIEATLEAAGCEVVGSADNADAAVRLAERERPDMMIMDIRLVGVRDGVEAAMEIWERFGIRSLFASANLDSATRARASRANPVGYIDKPFVNSHLLTALPKKTDL